MGVMIAYFSLKNYNYTDAQESVTSRIITLNDFIEDLNNDVGKATFIAAYRSLIAMEDHIALTGQYFNNSETAFEELFFNGTLNGMNKTIMNASSFRDYITRVSQIASDVGITMNMEIDSVTLAHKDPWHVAVTVNFSNYVNDTKETAHWTYKTSKETMVPIIELRDPIYSVQTLNRVPNVIIQTNLTPFVNDVADANDTTNLQIHANESYYIASTMAPSYVMRLEGNFSNSTYGIESLVNIQELTYQGLTIETLKSIVDYIYFDPNVSTTLDLCSGIINLTSWFKVERDHLQTYEIDPKLGPESEGYTCV